MATTAILTIKDISVGIKNGFGFDEFFEKYGLTEQELRDFIAGRSLKKRSYNDRIIRQIISNTKKNRKAAKRKTAPLGAEAG